MKKAVYSLFMLTVLFASCSDDEGAVVELNDNFDREAMLSNWANNIIVPGYQTYVASLEGMVTAKDAFITAPTEANLNTLQSSWQTAYIDWQKVSMFEIGKAEALTLRDFTNIYPTSTEKIAQAIATGEYNLALPSTRDQQGFPALDYLLFGSGNTSAEIAVLFAQSEAHRQYLSNVVDRLNELGSEVLTDWESGYAQDFVSSGGSSASSSVNKLVNDYMFYYEKALRAGKVGIPAGVFSNRPLSDRVEGLYNKQIAKQLLLTSINASQDFFEGKHANGSGPSLAAYLNFVEALTEGESLSASILGQFAKAKEEAEKLGNDFQAQVENDNIQMLTTYDALQANVVLMKVDMFQALNIRIDYVDADGD